MCQPSATFRVSSNAMRPLWTTFAFEKQTEQQLHFALRLMTEDWRSLRASNVYSVREMMQVEAAVMQGFVPMRAFVDKSKLSKFSPQLLLHHRQPRVKNRGLTVFFVCLLFFSICR